MSKRRFVNDLRRGMWVQRAFNFIEAEVGRGREKTEYIGKAVSQSKVLFEDAKAEAKRASDDAKGWAMLYCDRPGEIDDDTLDEAATLMVCGDLAEIGLDVRPVVLRMRGDSSTAHFAVMFGWEHGWRASADLHFPPEQIVRHLA